MAKKGAETDRRKELEKDISSYISTRRKIGGGFLKSISGIFKSSNDVTVKLHPEVEAYGKEKEERRKKEEKEEKAEEVEELEEEFEEGAKPGFLARVRNFFFEEEKAGSVEDIPPEEVEKVIEENRKKEEEEAQEEEGNAEIEDEYDEGVREKGLIAGFLGKLFGKAGANENVCADEIAEAVETIDDLKKVAEISTKVMKMLPPEKVKELKESGDFKDFKEILKRHNLIK